jgi:hypothetical protein
MSERFHRKALDPIGILLRITEYGDEIGDLTKLSMGLGPLAPAPQRAAEQHLGGKDVME